MQKFIYTKTTPLNYLFNILMIILFQFTTYLGYADKFWISLFKNNSLFNIVVLYGFLYYMLIFWTLSTFYLTLDLTKFSKYLHSFKVQPTQEIKKIDVIKASKVVLKNQIFGVLPILYVYYRLLDKDNYKISEYHSIKGDLSNFLGFCIFEELWFYTFHRLAHHRKIYKYVHKMHHEYKTPFCLTSQYCTLIEQIVINVTPLILGPYIFCAHPHVIFMWFLLSIVSAVHSHSDYNIPFMASVTFHDFHHYNYLGNYGVFMFMDRIFNTDYEYRKFKKNYLKYNIE